MLQQALGRGAVRYTEARDDRFQGVTDEFIELLLVLLPNSNRTIVENQRSKTLLISKTSFVENAHYIFVFGRTTEITLNLYQSTTMTMAR
jgi:hypothetical protein